MKKDKSLNDEQNLAVYSRGSSILVSAPAGSGKTKILVNRMMSLIEDDHVSVDSLLVLTFTKAAALEMKQRLIESLNKRIHIVDDSLKVHLEKQKILLNDAYITNFHSFCSDLLSQYGYTIHLDSKFEILENPTLIKENILNQCLEKWVQEKEFYDFYQENYTGYQFNSFKEILFQLDNLSHTVYHFDDYLDQYHIECLVKKYSDYVHYPIKMDVTTSKKKEDSDEYEDVVENKTLNSMVPIWKRNKKDIKDEEYNEFYKDKFNDFSDPMKVIHTSVEGNVSYSKSTTNEFLFK